jgi:hypothetical protein
MTVIQVERTAPQDIVGIQITDDTVPAILKLSRALSEHNFRFEFGNVTEFDGIGRLTIRRADFADQFAYDGDWLKVSNAVAVKDEKTGLVKEWQVSAITSVTVYGGGPAHPFNVEDFSATFTPVNS